MLTTYTLSEMKEIWRRKLGLLTDDCGCVVTRHDGISLDALIADHIRIWYAGLLVSEPAGLLPIRDMASEVTTARRYGENCIEIEFPPEGIRPVSVQLANWEKPLGVFHTAESPQAIRQRSSRLGGTPSHPVAIVTGRSMQLYGAGSSNTTASNAPDMVLLRLKHLYMVSAPEEKDTFILHQSLLSTIPTSI